LILIAIAIPRDGLMRLMLKLRVLLVKLLQIARQVLKRKETTVFEQAIQAVAVGF